MEPKERQRQREQWEFRPVAKAVAVGAVLFGVWILSGITYSSCQDHKASEVAAVSSKSESPLHGASPIFTIVAAPTCTNTTGPFCDQWEWCGGSAPKVSSQQKLWNVSVVNGREGALLVCEWRDVSGTP